MENKTSKRKNIILDLFLTFAKIGLFCFGGGYAMLSMIEHACVEQKQWISHDDMGNITVIAESTPGPIAINCATFVGYKQKSFAGAFAATIGVILPSFVIIFIISMFLDNFLDIGWVASAFKGIKLAVALLIIDAGCKLMKNIKKKPLAFLLMIFSCILTLIFDYTAIKVSSIILMLAAGFVSLVIYIIKEKGGELK